MGGSISDFLGIFKGNASFLVFELSEKRGGGWVDFELSAHIHKKREVLDIRTFRKGGAVGGSILDFLYISKSKSSFLIFGLSEREVERSNFLRISRRNASFLIFDFAEQERGRVGRFRTSFIFR